MSEELSDRDLDARVAERVMGWQHWRGEAGVYFLASDTVKISPTLRDYVERGKFTQVESGNEENAPHYSTDIAAAMTVLAKFQEKRFMWALNGSSEGGFWCMLYPPKGGFIESETVESPAKAVCLASLASLTERQEP